MKNGIKHIAAAGILVLMLAAMFCGCGRKSEAAEPAQGAANEAVNTASNEASESAAEVIDAQEPESETEETLSDEQVLSAIRNYCFVMNPDLEDIVKAAEYPAYWEIAASDDKEIVILFRSYTGALVRYYVDRATGDTYVTEFVPGITDEEQQTDESFNVRDYYSGEEK